MGGDNGAMDTDMEFIEVIIMGEIALQRSSFQHIRARIFRHHTFLMRLQKNQHSRVHTDTPDPKKESPKPEATTYVPKTTPHLYPGLQQTLVAKGALCAPSIA